jgi:hypothetical protein
MFYFFECASAAPCLFANAPRFLENATAQSLLVELNLCCRGGERRLSFDCSSRLSRIVFVNLSVAQGLRAWQDKSR